MSTLVPSPVQQGCPLGSALRSVRVLATACTIGLAAVVVTRLFDLWAGLEVRELSATAGVDAGSAGRGAQLQHLDSTLTTAALVLTALTAAAFVAWFSRARGNAATLAARARHGLAGSAITGWFRPVAHWVLPRPLAADIWRAGDQARPRDVWTVRGWWLLAVGTALVVQLVERPGPSALEQVDAYVAGSAVVQVLSALSYLLVLVVVRVLTARQVWMARTLTVATPGPAR